MDKGWRRVTFEGAELDVILQALKATAEIEQHYRDLADQQRAEIERLRAALKSFADLLDRIWTDKAAERRKSGAKR